MGPPGAHRSACTDAGTLQPVWCGRARASAASNHQSAAAPRPANMMAEEKDYSDYMNGPDQVIPCNNLITWNTAAPVKLRMER